VLYGVVDDAIVASPSKRAIESVITLISIIEAFKDLRAEGRRNDNVRRHRK